MFKNFYHRLLTRYPLLWNTRFPWVFSVALVIHVFFFWAGYARVTAEELQHFYSLGSISSPGLITFSALCSLGLIIVWLVFYLRNNAFKGFYIIGKYHGAKEFCIIVVTVFLAITFFESYRWGAWLKTRTITSNEQLVKEVNTVNLAMAFIPQSKSEYFKLNYCRDDGAMIVYYNDGYDYFDTTGYKYHDTNSAKIRTALKQSDAFSYKNYCATLVRLEGYRNYIPDKQWVITRNRWVDNRAIDSIKYILDECLAICKKYGIDQDINTGDLSQLVFKDSFFNVTRILPADRYDYDGNGNLNEAPGNFTKYELQNALRFADKCHLNAESYRDFLGMLTVELYIAVCLSILLLCYRLYNRKVFLISIVGMIVWAIFFALVGYGFRTSESIGWFYLVLFGLFATLTAVLLKGDSNKTTTGVLLNWHVYMIPFVILVIVQLINNYYDQMQYYSTDGYRYPPDEELRKNYPVGYWVEHHTELLSRLNLLFVFLYTTFVFTRLSKKWHITPEE